MLHYETIEPSTLELLKRIQKLEIFRDLRLVGGTSLALQYGHRRSIDIDLFGKLDANEFEISEELKSLGEVRLLQKTKLTFIYLINGIKTDIISFSYDWLEDTLMSDGIRLAGKKDIAAMKLAAVTGRGTRKDFIDIWFLLKEFSLKQMIHFYSTKYPDGAEFLVLKSLGYFGDAEKDPMPDMLDDVTWDKIKTGIKDSLQEYLK